MKVLVLVVSGGSDPIYKKHKSVWRQNTHPQITSVFIEYSSSVTEITLHNDTLFLPGTESLIGMTRKTLDSLRYFLQDETFTHVIRTNLSSMWHFPRLIEQLELLPANNLFAGFLGHTFVSGAGMYFSRDVCVLLLDHYESTCASTEQDDLAISNTLSSIGIPMTPLQARFDILTPEAMETFRSVSLPTRFHHFRFKQHGDRSVEPEFMQEVLRSFSGHIESNEVSSGHHWCHKTRRFISR